MRIALVTASVTLFGILVGCGASDPDSRAEESATSASEAIVRNLPLCPSTWCGVTTPCSSWDCRITNSGSLPQQHSCRQTFTAAGSSCTDPSTCITAGTCSGATPECHPKPLGVETCATTSFGQQNGYQCGSCNDGECYAVHGGDFVLAPAGMCSLVAE